MTMNITQPMQMECQRNTDKLGDRVVYHRNLCASFKFDLISSSSDLV